MDFWQGPRPRVFGAEVEGPTYRTWSPKRQRALVGDSPRVANAEAILKPIATRAWRRDVRDGELDPMVRLVNSREVERILARSTDNGYRVVDTIAAVIDSPLFRER